MWIGTNWCQIEVLVEGNVKQDVLDFYHHINSRHFNRLTTYLVSLSPSVKSQVRLVWTRITLPSVDATDLVIG